MAELMRSILLLEADSVTEALYKRELSRHFRVFTDPDEGSALRLLRAQDIRAIVLEPKWASGRGWHFLGELNRIEDRLRPPVIICSVLDERRVGYQLGVAAYCVKPVLPTTLLAALRTVLKSEFDKTGRIANRNK